MFVEICLWNLYFFSGEIMECGDYDDMDYGMSVVNVQELLEENYFLVIILEYFVVYSEDCLIDYLLFLIFGYD